MALKPVVEFTLTRFHRHPEFQSPMSRLTAKVINSSLLQLATQQHPASCRLTVSCYMSPRQQPRPLRAVTARIQIFALTLGQTVHGTRLKTVTTCTSSEYVVLAIRLKDGHAHVTFLVVWRPGRSTRVHVNPAIAPFYCHCSHEEYFIAVPYKAHIHYIDASLTP
jgi:hypothetical protein